MFVPVNHYASKFVVEAQDNLMKARDERVALMNEVCSHLVLFNNWLIFLDTWRDTDAQGALSYCSTFRF